MSYIALYRKYRPGTFDSIVGQENVTKILKNQIKSGKISHAYIFSGSRGTGKTSAAKVFARAINCLNVKDGEPCNECEVCKNILEGNTTDVIEMDAASNNSVENIRQIRQEVVYTTIDVKYRVYIIDEAHMLTTSAFNALLKTLEEPPKNVVFILATTEQHKIPVTILSRCLRFEFNRISDSDIVSRVEYVLKEENIEYEKEAVEYIAKLAEGGMRDALSILDRCISESSSLKYDDVIRIVGAIDKQVISQLVEEIVSLNSVAAIQNIDEVVKRGKDLRQLTYQLSESFLEILIKDDGKKVDRYIQIINKLSKLDNDLRLTSKPVIVLKSAIVEICSLNLSSGESTENVASGNKIASSSSFDSSALIQKISTLENEIERLKNKLNSGNFNNTNTINNASGNISNSVSSASSSKGINTNNTSSVQTVNKSSRIASPVVDNVDDESLTEFVDAANYKKAIVERGKLKLYSSIADSKIYMNDTSLVIITNNSFAYSILVLAESIKDLKEIYVENYGDNKNIVVRLKEVASDNSSKMEKVFRQNDVNYTSID